MNNIDQKEEFLDLCRNLKIVVDVSDITIVEPNKQDTQEEISHEVFEIEFEPEVTGDEDEKMKIDSETENSCDEETDAFDAHEPDDTNQHELPISLFKGKDQNKLKGKRSYQKSDTVQNINYAIDAVKTGREKLFGLKVVSYAYEILLCLGLKTNQAARTFGIPKTTLYRLCKLRETSTVCTQD